MPVSARASCLAACVGGGHTSLLLLPSHYQAEPCGASAHPSLPHLLQGFCQVRWQNPHLYDHQLGLIVAELIRPAAPSRPTRQLGHQTSQLCRHKGTKMQRHKERRPGWTPSICGALRALHKDSCWSCCCCKSGAALAAVAAALAATAHCQGHVQQMGIPTAAPAAVVCPFLGSTSPASWHALMNTTVWHSVMTNSSSCHVNNQYVLNQQAPCCAQQ
jgi:hypothetical protein